MFPFIGGVVGAEIRFLWRKRMVEGHSAGVHYIHE